MIIFLLNKDYNDSISTMSSQEEALIELLKAEPYKWGSDRYLNKRKLQLRYIAEHMPETHQKYWRIRVHHYFIEHSKYKNQSPRVVAILNDAANKIHEGRRRKKDGIVKPLSTRRVNKIALRVYKELKQFIKAHPNRGQDRWKWPDGKVKGWTSLDYDVEGARSFMYWMSKHLGMYLNMATVEDTCIGEILDTEADEEYIETDKIVRKYKKELLAKKIERHTRLCPNIAELIASF